MFASNRRREVDTAQVSRQSLSFKTRFAEQIVFSANKKRLCAKTTALTRVHVHLRTRNSCGKERVRDENQANIWGDFVLPPPFADQWSEMRPLLEKLGTKGRKRDSCGEVSETNQHGLN